MIEIASLTIQTLSGTEYYVINDKQFRKMSSLIEYLVEIGFTDKLAIETISKLKRERNEYNH
ncbi:MAG TPA: hypothetical protein DCX27_05175 [Balneola sp.]|nr:hypothetical protein [Balneola sp.]|tara:strand:- start:748 stop:933 length:186 start_codon:yes stop_codon:yes gene_type:complete